MAGHGATNYVASAQRTIRMESEAVAALEVRVGEAFERACECLPGKPLRLFEITSLLPQ